MPREAKYTERIFLDQEAPTRELTGPCSGRFLVTYCQCVWRDEPMTTVLQKLLVALVSTALLAALVLWDATSARVVQTVPAHAGQIQ